MSVYYYVSLFPMEGLIASQLEPVSFGTYMSIGSSRTSADKLIFAEIEGDFGRDFDWKYAQENCVEHEDGRPKNSLYLSIYRILEFLDPAKIKAVYLTTRDGRSLPLKPQTLQSPPSKAFFLYQELCPIIPMVVSRLDPMAFCDYMTAEKSKTSVPVLAFADLKVIDFDNPENTGNIGPVYDGMISHIKNCVSAVTGANGKNAKIVDRSHTQAFSYQSIDSGIYIGKGKNLAYFPMLSLEDIQNNHYEWGKSAQIL